MPNCQCELVYFCDTPSHGNKRAYIGKHILRRRKDVLPEKIAVFDVP